ncbi:STAS domain-containing protein [Jatrophihabitans sp.]|jgi:anti-anti-sigma regulatory factor|uniref:STAS domain-containing protein n=1 Tax=Jatrophihabitans sp. TaxID=1932789 RepID=UPI002F134DDF
MATDPYHSNAEGERHSFALRVGGCDPERVIFFLRGDLLGPSCSPFEYFTRECIDAGTRRLRLDLTDLRSLDLDGVDTLVVVHQWLSAVGGRLVVTNANAEVMSVLRLFGRPLRATRTSVVFAPAVTPPVGRAARRRLAG